MAGFPFWQLDRFLKVLVQDLNKYVAISEEFVPEVASKLKSGGLLFDRRVARVITPGTLIDEKFLDPYESNFLLSVHGLDHQHGLQESVSEDGLMSLQQTIGLAWLDLSTGAFYTQTASRGSLASTLTRIGAREIIVPGQSSRDLCAEIELMVSHDHRLVTLHECEKEFASMLDWKDMLESPVFAEDEAQFTLHEKAAGHQLLDYVRNRLQGMDLRLQPPQRREIRQVLSIDRASLRGLEILQTSRDGLGKGSLLHAIRRTSTKSGARLLKDRLTSPSASLAEINERLELVALLVSDDELRENLTQHLQWTYDVQRLVQKFALNKGDADDMLSLARAIAETCNTRSLLRAFNGGGNAPQTRESSSSGQKALSGLLDRLDMSGPAELSDTITQAIDEEGLMEMHRQEEDEAADTANLVREITLHEAPEQLRTLPKAVQNAAKRDDGENEAEESWIMRKNASDTLSRLHDDLEQLKQDKRELTLRLRKDLSAPSLTLRWTPSQRYVCHIRSATKFDKEKLHAMSAEAIASSKSTRTFYLSDWSHLGSRLDEIIMSIRKEEQRIFAELRQLVITNLVKLRRNAAVMDELDVAASFATLAKEQSWTRPILNDGISHKIVGGRHPTVKLGLEEQGRSFVSNDLFLGGKERIWLVTGPNMAGKSTFLRQNALISVLAQVGSYVPAEHAEIGLVDQIFSRIGAADDLFRDQSTFMVEMLETAAILKQATPRSFVIMDEVGRGTTPEDGTAVGYACLHHLHYTNKCRTLFATHFHALADMTEEWACLGRYCTDVLEDNSGSFSFIHRLRQGVNRQSHALKVARLAGLPQPALDVAKVVLKQLLDEKHSVYLDTKQGDTRPPSMAAAAG